MKTVAQAVGGAGLVLLAVSVLVAGTILRSSTRSALSAAGGTEAAFLIALIAAVLQTVFAVMLHSGDRKGVLFWLFIAGLAVGQFFAVKAIINPAG